MKKLGIGVQSFGHFQTENFIYVDKTEKIYEMMQLGMHNFYIRPRRFGKSLLLNTIENIYKGRKDLFEGTWIYDKIAWKPRPVLRIDFTSIDSVAPLENALVEYLRKVAKRNNIEITATSAAGMFEEMIQMLGKDEPVAIMIDEYEMAVTGYVGKNDAKMNENIDVLKKFYGVMKGANDYIHRSFITGVSKIGKISILSDLNMLNDLTLDARFTTLLGYTEKELRFFYADYITLAAKHLGISEEELLIKIRLQYNGYSWDGIEENKVYNPFSIVNFFQSFKFRNYWFGTGTPTVLIRGARKQQITLEELEHVEVSGNLLENANLQEFYSLSLLFQAGYLTIKEVYINDMYLLGFPNQEVRNSFASYILAEYTGQDWAYMDTRENGGFVRLEGEFTP